MPYLLGSLLRLGLPGLRLLSLLLLLVLLLCCFLFSPGLRLCGRLTCDSAVQPSNA